MNLLSIYEKDIPSFLLPYLSSVAMQRLKGVDMNCGMNFTSFPVFRDLEPYSRYDHSLGVALIVWHFTHNRIQALAGLFHDIATPAFSHVTDFMRGDYLKQEASENETSMVIHNDPDIMKQLSQDEISPDQVSDYHLYPIADNDSPHLSADRLEYTCGDIVDYHFGTAENVRALYNDLIVLKNEDGIDEIGFMHPKQTEQFARYALQCGKIYSCKEDRYAMDRLSDLLKECIADHTLEMSDLYTSEKEVIRKIRMVHEKEWKEFTSLSRVVSLPADTKGARMIRVKKRYIDPLVMNQGRVSDLDPDLKKDMLAFRNDEMNEWLKGDTF